MIFSGVLTRIGTAIAAKAATSRTGRRVGAKVLRQIADKLEDDQTALEFQESVNRRFVDSERRQSRTLYIAVLALAIAIGHVVYAIIRDHVFDGSIF